MFDTTHEVSSRQLKYFGKLKDGGKRGTVFTAFEEAYVLGVVPALEGKLLLSEMTLLPELNEDPRKRSLLWRALFVPSWHPQLEFAACQSILPQSIVSHVQAAAFSAAAPSHKGWR